MRLSTVAGACALLMSTSVPVSAQVPQKFAFINSQQLMQTAPGRAEAELQFQKEMEMLRAQVAKLGDSLNVLQTAYQKEEVSLSAAAKEPRLKALREKEAEYQDRVTKLNEQAQQREAELMQPVMDLVRRVLDEVRTERGYSFIFDVAAASVIVSVDKNLDITDVVQSKLRLSAPPKAALKALTPVKPPTGPAVAPAGVTTKKPPTT